MELNFEWIFATWVQDAWKFFGHVLSLQQNVFLVTKKFVTKSPIFRH